MLKHTCSECYKTFYGNKGWKDYYCSKKCAIRNICSVCGSKYNCNKYKQCCSYECYQIIEEVLITDNIDPNSLIQINYLGICQTCNNSFIGNKGWFSDYCSKKCALYNTCKYCYYIINNNNYTKYCSRKCKINYKLFLMKMRKKKQVNRLVKLFEF